MLQGQEGSWLFSTVNISKYDKVLILEKSLETVNCSHTLLLQN